MRSKTLSKRWTTSSCKPQIRYSPEFYRKLQEKNSPEGIEADFSYEFRLLGYGRQRALALQKLDYLKVLLSEKKPMRKDRQAVRLGFELGFAAAEHRLMSFYEDYIHDGVAMAEWRHAGLPLAREERLRQAPAPEQKSSLLQRSCMPPIQH